MNIRFEWDAAKAAANLKKHGVGFDLAMRVFSDPFAMSHQDRFEGGEQCWQTIGMVDGLVLLLVAHTLRDEDGSEVVRIISARKATRQEQRGYEQEHR